MSIFVQVLQGYLKLFFFLKDKLITSAWNETCRTSWTPCSSVLDASHANAPTHQITLNTDTQLHGVIPIYKPKERQLSLCRAHFFLSISISKSIFARRRKVFHKLSAALHCWRSFKLISNAYLHPAFKPSDGSQIKVSRQSISVALVTLPTCWPWLLSTTRASHRRQNKWHGNNGRHVPLALCTFRSVVQREGGAGRGEGPDVVNLSDFFPNLAFKGIVQPKLLFLITVLCFI